MMFKRVLLAIDPSESGQVAVSYTMGLAAQFGAVVRVMLAAPGTTLESQGAALVNEAVCKLRTAGIDTSGGTRTARRNRVGGCIAEEVRSWQADAVVLGLDRRHVAGGRFTHGVQAHLARRSPVPVLVPPSPLRASSDVVAVGVTPV
jgi:nucleotide-binding universal stress UspA family protein